MTLRGRPFLPSRTCLIEGKWLNGQDIQWEVQGASVNLARFSSEVAIPQRESVQQGFGRRSVKNGLRRPADSWALVPQHQWVVRQDSSGVVALCLHCDGGTRNSPQLSWNGQCFQVAFLSEPDFSNLGLFETVWFWNISSFFSVWLHWRLNFFRINDKWLHSLIPSLLFSSFLEQFAFEWLQKPGTDTHNTVFEYLLFFEYSLSYPPYRKYQRYSPTDTARTDYNDSVTSSTFSRHVTSAHISGLSSGSTTSRRSCTLESNFSSYQLTDQWSHLKWWNASLKDQRPIKVWISTQMIWPPCGWTNRDSD